MMKNIITIFIMFFSVLIPVKSFSMLSLEFNEQTKVSEQFITLGDIAAIKDEDSVLCEKLKEIVVGYAPPPKMSKIFSTNYIKTKLRQNGIILEEAVIRYPNKIEITSDYNEIKGEVLIEVAKKYLSELIKDDKDICIVPPQFLSSIIVPKGDFELLPEARLTNQFVSNVNVTVNCKIKGNIYNKVRVPFVVNKVKKPYVVKKGESIKIVIKTPTISLCAMGNVMESGMLGEIVKARNTDSGKIISGKIVDSKTLLVEMR
ncbi:flagellar basal body P-ring formation protein FlgA [Candidatus Poribacteria bacterium]|nr:flagellar basal body P-ring formation protein FlgA [Candidatus Poribacteria bacterium]